MPDRHRDPTVTVRPAEEVKNAASAVLGKRGWTVQEYLLASIGELLADPDRRITDATPYRPPPKPLGRPRKREANSTSARHGHELAHEVFEEAP